MSMPKQIKVGGILYPVRLEPNPETNGNPVDGYIDHGQAEITIKENMGKQVQVQTILHEILHAIEVQSGRHHELKEPMVDALAFGIYQVLRENPDLVRVIVK